MEVVVFVIGTLCLITLSIIDQIHVTETKGTLQFATRAKNVTNCAQVNEVRYVVSIELVFHLFGTRLVFLSPFLKHSYNATLP